MAPPPTSSYLFAQPGIAYSSSAHAPPPASSPQSSTARQPPPSSSSSHAPYGTPHSRSDSTGQSSSVPLPSAASSTSHLLQRSPPHQSHAAMPPSSSIYSPSASRDATGAPLLDGYAASTSSSSAAAAASRNNPFGDSAGFERLQDSVGGASARGGDQWSRGSGAAPYSARGSISSLGSANSMGYAPRAQNGMYYDDRSVASHATSSMGQQYALGGDPSQWARSGSPEPDDYLHTPDPKRDHRKDHGGTILTLRGLMNLGCILILALALFMLFAGYPILSEIQKARPRTLGAFNLGGVNASGQVPAIVGNFGLIDADTPESAYSIVSDEGTTWELVFSDEFEQDGRTFWPGDDPYFEAINLHAWGTNDLEWYDPRMTTTANGKLLQTLEEREKNDLNYTGASIQSWNKFCFQGGRLEASIRLPGSPTVNGLWPAFWTMGNLGRVGYGGTLEGLWPYSYDSCDVGTMPNQTLNGEPAANLHNGLDSSADYALSYLSGQRLSSCTCPDDETHPGPKKANGEWRGRSAPEIDVIEAQVANGVGEVSLSTQWAPFDAYYEWKNTTAEVHVTEDRAFLNTYKGGPFQQTTSFVGVTDQECYQYPLSGAGEGCFSTYAIEYKTGDEGYIKYFIDDQKFWTYHEGGMGPNAESGISNRPVPYEPMYIIFNLAISENFGAIDYEGLRPMFPMHMEVEWLRVYQDPDDIRIGCDPEDAPTAEYIDRYLEAYHNPNITTWDQMTDNGPLPKNRLIDTC